MNRTSRNKIMIWVIVLGLANFAVYTFFYWYLQGDARNGFIENGQYFLRGHFIRLPDGHVSAAVSRACWIYSFIHSISIWPTIGAVLISMLWLARPHIIATMRSDSIFSGTAFVNLCTGIVVLVTVASTALFVHHLIQALSAVAEGRDFGL